MTLYGLPLVPRRTVGYGQIDPAVSRDLFIQHGIATDDEMQIETLAARLRDEIVNNNGVFSTVPALGIWART